MFFKFWEYLNMAINRRPGVSAAAALFLAVVFAIGPSFIRNGYGQILQQLPSREVEVDVTAPLPTVEPQTLAVIQGASWSYVEKLAEKDDELLKVPVSIGPREITYYENRVSIAADGSQTVSEKKSSDRERVIGLKLLNLDTGEVTVIKVETDITRDGVKIVAPAGYDIQIVERANGIRWNLWNTAYRVVSPANTIVIKNNFPREETVTTSRVVNGKTVRSTRKVTKGFLYAPYSEYIHQDELIRAGRDYIKGVVAQAFNNLRARGIKSRAFPDQLIADVAALSPRFFERLPLLEQGDLTEFVLDPKMTAERVLVIVGANRENAFAPTCNSVSACGWVQFTPPTYRYMRQLYPSAGLMADFRTGAGDHVNSITAAILLHDSNLKPLIDKFGQKIVNDERLEEYLAASYNGSPSWVWQSLTATLGQTVSDWTKHLRQETLGFMFKLRYLVENELP